LQKYKNFSTYSEFSSIFNGFYGKKPFDVHYTYGSPFICVNLF